MMRKEIRLTSQDCLVILTSKLILIVCKRPFTNVVMKISYKDGVLVVSMRNKNVEEEFQECFRIDQHIDLSFEKFFFISATSGMALNNHHYLYSIKAYDLDQKVDKNQYERSKRLDKGS